MKNIRFSMFFKVIRVGDGLRLTCRVERGKAVLPRFRVFLFSMNIMVLENH